MKTIWLKILNLINKNKTTGIIILLILILFGVIYIQRQRIEHWKDNYNNEVNLNVALNDTVRTYRNQRNELVVEKQTIQASVKRLEEINDRLTDSQKELMTRIREANKKNSIIAAALIETNAKIDSLLDASVGGDVVIDTAKKTINFNNLTAEKSFFKYDIDVNNVLPVHPDIRPTMLFKSIILPNQQFIDFSWKDDKKKGYPISFSVSNTNPYFSTVNIESYAIPNITKKHLDPNGWQKIGNFLFKHGKTVIYFGAGAVVGGGTVYLLTK